MKINKVFTNVITLSIITSSTMYTTSLIFPYATPGENTYQNMSITELQKKVENLSQNGNLPFDMGLELLKRWTQKS
ncbi:MAG: hypothetical protein DRG09_05935 [Epsilonproteobacteria bacterium]|nr:MAG: hypothetical protein DRG09_05935 [Campylobacterota bacterium]